MNATITEILRKRGNLRRAKKFFEMRLNFTAGPTDLKAMREQGEDITIIDVRKPEDYARGHIPGAVNLPKASWSSFTGLRKDRVNVIYCYTPVCQLAARAAMYFAEHDFPVMELLGGMETWKQHGFPVESSKEKMAEERPE
jgi:rhodanese-related sulfurtransferase